MLPGCTCVKLFSPTQSSLLQYQREQESSETEQIQYCALGKQTHGSRIHDESLIYSLVFLTVLAGEGHNSHHVSDTSRLPLNRISSLLPQKLPISISPVVASEKLSAVPPRIGWEEFALSCTSRTCQMTC